MLRFVSILVAASLLQGAPAADSARLRWIANPRTTGGSWVADPAHHLKPATVTAIDSTISALERETSSEIAVVVADSLDGLEPADAALLLHRRWGVGKRQRDNGLVLLWSPALRKVQVSVGYGLEGVLPDARVGRIEGDSVIPYFRRGDFDAGVLAGVRALAAASREETAWRPEGIAPGRATSPVRMGGGTSDRRQLPLFLGLGLGLAGLLGIGGATAWRYRPRRCPNGHGRMRKLSEAEDDAQLTREEGLEERLGSVNYDVYVCDSCGARVVEAHRKLFSKYSACPKCSRRTLETNTVTLVAATTVSTGRQRVIRNCRNCAYHDQREVVTPMISTSSGSGGSSFGGGGGGGGGGGSSFGGGSAGGGGAGRSY